MFKFGSTWCYALDAGMLPAGNAAEPLIRSQALLSHPAWVFMDVVHG
jgi:hypothetical protein